VCYAEHLFFVSNVFTGASLDAARHLRLVVVVFPKSKAKCFLMSVCRKKKSASLQQTKQTKKRTKT
jgi:hypothetical protein